MQLGADFSFEALSWRQGADSTFGATADATPELVELSEPEPFSVFHHHHGGIGNVDPDLDDHGGDQNVDLARAKGIHDRLALIDGLSAMKHRQPTSAKRPFFEDFLVGIHVGQPGL